MKDLIETLNHSLNQNSDYEQRYTKILDIALKTKLAVRKYLCNGETHETIDLIVTKENGELLETNVQPTWNTEDFEHETGIHIP